MEVLDDVEDIFIDPVYDLMNVIHKEFVKIAKFGFEYSEEILNFEYENS